MAIGTTIDGLNAVTSLTTNDEMPVWDKEASGEPTKKITASNLASSVKSLASLPNTTEMNAAIAQSTAAASNVISVSVGNTQYVSSVSGGYIQFGKLVVFSIGYTLKTAISQSVSGAISGLPIALKTGRYLVYDDASTFGITDVPFANVENGVITIKGAHSAGKEYYISGAYIAQ